MKKLDSRTKGEQLFILLLMYVIFISGVCIAGCGGQSCESLKYGSEEGDGFKAAGCSIPGFGGCLSFEKGCNSACWPQSCKISNGTYSGEGTNDKGCVTSLDMRYYGDGCFGCGQSQKSCYVGLVNWNIENMEAKGIFYGSSDKTEHVAGCYNGCIGCMETADIFGQYMYQMERLEGID